MAPAGGTNTQRIEEMEVGLEEVKHTVAELQQQFVDQFALLTEKMTEEHEKLRNSLNTGKSVMGDGEGFKQMFRSLADLNGMVILCSNEGRVKLSQTPLGRQATAEFTGPFPGVQLSVNCSLNGPPQERQIAI